MKKIKCCCKTFKYQRVPIKNCRNLNNLLLNFKKEVMMNKLKIFVNLKKIKAQTKHYFSFHLLMKMNFLFLKIKIMLVFQMKLKTNIIHFIKT